MLCFSGSYTKPPCLFSGGRTTCLQVGDTCSDPQHFDRMLSDRPFPVPPFSLQPSVCVFGDSTKAQCHVAVPMSFGLVACVSVFSDGTKQTAVCPFSWPLASMTTPVLQAFVLVFSDGNPPRWSRCDLPGSKALGQIDR